MLAVRCHTLVGPKGLRLDTIDAPSPGPHEVLIEVRAAGLNFPDVLMTYGRYQFKADPPFVPGLEASGVVHAVGEGVTGFAPGDRVAATVTGGAFAELLVAPESSVVKLPDGLSFEQGAATLLTYLTTLHALVDRAALQPKETLVVLGASGGVGTAAVELGRWLGAKVIASASSDEKVAFCKSAGADEGINYTREDLKERIKTLTAGHGADVLYDPVGGPFADAALRSMAWEGRYLVVGFAAGEIPKIPLNLVLLKGCQVVGVFWGAFAKRSPEQNLAHARRLLEGVARGELTPRIDSVVPFSDAQRAFERMEQRGVMGKLLLVP